MNYLAHVFLARPTPLARLGALLGDFARGLDTDLLPEEALDALQEHRAIAAFVDAHPLTRSEREQFPPELRRFSGILLDVYHDHFLARHWDRFTDDPLEEVTGSLYSALRDHSSLLPPRLLEVAPRMSAQDWLGGYAELENIDRALAGISRRMRRETPLERGGEELRRRYPDFEQLSLEMFEQLTAFVDQRRHESPGLAQHG